MTPKKYDSADELLKDPSGDIAKLRGIGITDFAIITYLVRVSEGQSKESALRGLLLGRSLSGEQQLFVRLVLDRFRLPKFSSEGGHMRLDPAIIGALDRAVGDSERVFFGGLLLILSPLLMSVLSTPLLGICLMFFGLLCSAGALIGAETVRMDKPRLP